LAVSSYRGSIVLACSFGGPSGIVILDLLHRAGESVPVYYLDTDLLFAQTYALVERVKARYGIEPIPVRSKLDLREQTERYGDTLWSRDPDACCALRKVEPQAEFLRSYRAWITGIRHDQSATRRTAHAIDWDERFGLVKVNPLVDWTENDVWAYIRKHDLPYNALHDEGYPSIGCEPCTRRVGAGEDLRAGRWSGFTKTECGLHAPSIPTESTTDG
jgi:phosphoadenosine phosphosulfate reductase